MNAPFKAPVVDSLSVRVVVDSVFDQFMPKATHPMCTIEHVGRIRHNLNSTLAGEWGLSLHLESRTVSARLWLHAGDPGGFHLGVAPPDYVEHTIAELKAMAPDLVIPMHCTGRAFIAKMREEMPEQLVDWNTGSRFTFGV